MRSFFLNLLLCFSLALAVAGLAWVLIAALEQRDPLMMRVHNATGRGMEVHAQTAAETYERDGEASLDAYLARVDTALQIRTALFDGEGHQVGGEPAPLVAAALARRTGALGDAPRAITRLLMGAHSVRTSQGRLYVLISYVSGGLVANLAWPALRFLCGLMAAGLSCYGLARYISTPVLRLRAATRRLAEGDLTARVGDTLGNRRDELAELGRDFDLMASRIETLLNSQHRLLGDISHELRSPLTRLNVALELARLRAGDEVAGALDRIERESERLNELIGQLLTLTRLESGADKAGDQPIDLAQSVREIAADSDFEALSRGRSVRLVACDPCHTLGTASLLRSAIENVVRNAVRYTAEQTDVEVSLQTLEKSSRRYALITVRDHGPGVPEEALASLFLPFYRVADARERNTGGTGLGLAITDRAVRLHGGEVTAHNAPDGGGLIVEITLPLSTRK